MSTKTLLGALSLAILAVIIIWATPAAAAPVSGDIVVITDNTTLGGYMDLIVNVTSLQAKQWMVQEIYLYLDTHGLAELSSSAWILLGPASDRTIYVGSVSLEGENLVFLRIRLPDTEDFNAWVESDSDGKFFVKAYGGPGLIAVSNSFIITPGRATVEKAADAYTEINNYKFSYVANHWVGSSEAMNFTLNFTALFDESIDLTKSNSTSLKLVNTVTGQELCLACGDHTTLTSDVVNEAAIDVTTHPEVLNITNAHLKDFALNLTGTGTESVGGISVPFADFKLEGYLEFSGADYYNLTDVWGDPTTMGVTSAFLYDWLSTTIPEDILASIDAYWEESIANYTAKFRKFYTEQETLRFYPSIEVTYNPSASSEDLDLGTIDIVGHQFPADTTSDFIYLYLSTDTAFSQLTAINVSMQATVGNDGTITLTGVELPFAPYGGEDVYVTLVVNQSDTKFSSLPSDEPIVVEPEIAIGVADASGTFVATDNVAPYDYVLIKGVGFHAGSPVAIKIFNDTALLATITTQVAEDGSLTTDSIGNFTAVIRVPTAVVDKGYFNFTAVDSKDALAGTTLRFLAYIDGSVAKVFIGDFKVTISGIIPEDATIRYAYNATWEPTATRTLFVEIIGAKQSDEAFNITLFMDSTMASNFGLTSEQSYLVAQNVATSYGYAKLTVNMPEALWAGNYTVVVKNETDTTWSVDSSSFTHVTVMPTVAALGRFPADTWAKSVSVSLEDTVDFMGFGWGNATIDMTVAGTLIYTIETDELSQGKFLIEDIPVARLSPTTYSVRVYFEQADTGFKEYVTVNVLRLPTFDVVVSVSTPKVKPGEVLDIFILPRLDGAPFAEAQEGVGTLDKIVVKVFVKSGESALAELYKTIVITSDNIAEYTIDPDTGLLHVMVDIPEAAVGKALVVEVSGEATLFQFAKRSYSAVAAVSVMNLDELASQTAEKIIEGVSQAISTAESNLSGQISALESSLSSKISSVESSLSSSISSVQSSLSSEINSLKTQISELATKDDVSQVASKVESLGGSVTMYGAASVILAVIILGLLAYSVFARKG